MKHLLFIITLLVAPIASAAIAPMYSFNGSIDSIRDNGLLDDSINVDDTFSGFLSLSTSIDPPLQLNVSINGYSFIDTYGSTLIAIDGAVDVITFKANAYSDIFDKTFAFVQLKFIDESGTLLDDGLPELLTPEYLSLFGNVQLNVSQYKFKHGKLESYLLNGTVDIPAVPVPAAAWLFASGLLGMVGIARRKA